jgi:2-succinyl-5-enolpyruvyl-6-hydroxy-3-cyclohexene-1-carboxylate synthase
MAKELSSKIPAGWVLHTGILNSFRSWNLFPPKNAVSTFSNVGGFGIDGCLSTAIGASLANPQKNVLCILGDLAFFYDINALGNRAVGKNLRILLINNGCGTEFNMYWHPGSQFNEQTNEYIAAGGHFANKSRNLVRNFTQDLGFNYLSAENKNDFLQALPQLLQESTDKSIVLECFTDSQQESEAHRLMRNLNPHVPEHPSTTVRDMIPRRLKNIAKAVVGR